jgi:hypothetical protein
MDITKQMSLFIIVYVRGIVILHQGTIYSSFGQSVSFVW